MILNKTKSLTNRAREAIMEIVIKSDFMAKLPSESEMSAMFGISRNTVREAIKMLEHEGLIISRHGVGTFVIHSGDGLRYNITNLNSTTEIIRSQGFKPNSRAVCTEVRPAAPAIAKQLRIAPGSDIIYLERIRTADDKPVIIVEDYIQHQADVFEKLAGDAPQSLFSVLSEAGLTVSFSSCSLDATISNAEQMGFLELDAPRALLVLRQTHFTRTGEPVLYSDSYFLPDQLEFNLIRRL